MGSGCSSLSYPFSSSTCVVTSFSISSPSSSSSSLKLNPRSFLLQSPNSSVSHSLNRRNLSTQLRNQAPLRSLEMESQKPMFDVEKFDDEFVQKLVYDALVWSSLHGLVVGDKTYQVSCATTKGVWSCFPITLEKYSKIDHFYESCFAD